jgi:xanthosine utilization system XapX-like protein
MTFESSKGLADTSMDQTLVFHWRDAYAQKAQRLAFALLALMIVAAIAALWFIFPEGAWKKVDWSSLVQKLLNTPEGWFKGILAPLIGIVVLWGQSKYQKHARLILNDETIRFSSGVPVFRQWLDWSMELADVRSKKIALDVIGSPIGAQPMRMYRLSWGATIFKQIRPSVWHLPNQTDVDAVRPKSYIGLVRWGTPENIAILQQQFKQLPLIHALKSRGIEFPALTGKLQQFSGTDLMAHPRMKTVVIGFFSTLIAAGALYHLMRHQHYFTAPPVIAWVAIGVLAGICMLTWLWLEQPFSVANDRKKMLEFRATQVLMACLFAFAVGLCAPSLPLALSSLVKSSQEISFTLQKSPLLLRAQPGSGVPEFSPRQALDYWASLPNGEAVTLPVRQGFAGWWWQFDSSVLSDKLDAFYDAQDRIKSKKK